MRQIPAPSASKASVLARGTYRPRNSASTFGKPSNRETVPFARLRGGTVLEAGAEVGNFVEVKASTLGPGAKAKHLAYLGDGDIGAGANIGAGTILCNYDGKGLQKARIGLQGD